MESKFKEIEKETGLKISLGSISYTPTTFQSKMSVVLANGKSTATLRKEEFEKNCWLFNVPKDSFGKYFKSNGDTVQIIGLKPCSRKYPVIGFNTTKNGEYLYQAKVAIGELKDTI